MSLESQSIQVGPMERPDNRPLLSLILGLVSIFGLFPFIQLPAGIAGLVLGIRSRSSANRGLAIAGIVLSAVGLLFMGVLIAMFIGPVQQLGLEGVIRAVLAD